MIKLSQPNFNQIWSCCDQAVWSCKVSHAQKSVNNALDDAYVFTADIFEIFNNIFPLYEMKIANVECFQI